MHFGRNPQRLGVRSPYWPADRIEAGDWTPAAWRSPELAEAAWEFANNSVLAPIGKEPIYQTGRTLSGPFQWVARDVHGSTPVLKSKGADGQLTIKSTPDAHMMPKDVGENGWREVSKLLSKSGHLLITDGQDSASARLTATADDEHYVGVGWLPVVGLASSEAKALAVFFNSTAGRLQIMRNAARKLTFPMYRPAGVGNVRVPDVKDDRIRSVLAAAWERTKDMLVPQYRDGECEVRAIWDEAVAEAMGWDPARLMHLRLILHNEPHVRGLGYGQYGDAPGVSPDDEEFEE